VPYEHIGQNIHAQQHTQDTETSARKPHNTITFITIMKGHLAIRISSLVLDMILINYVVEIDYKPTITIGSELWRTAILALIATHNLHSPLAEPTSDSAPRHTQPKLVSDLLRNAVAPPTGERCSVCLRAEFTTPVQISCGHVFCRQCALTIFAQRLSCLVCSAIAKPLDRHEARTEQASDMVFELKQGLKFLAGSVVLTLPLFLCVLLLRLTLYPGEWESGVRYTIAYFALFTAVMNIAISCCRCKWWSVLLVLVVTSTCTMAATYNSATRLTSRTGNFWDWWSFPLIMIGAMPCGVAVISLVAMAFRNREKVVKLLR
jgi:hypothetical protein